MTGIKNNKNLFLCHLTSQFLSRYFTPTSPKSERGDPRNSTLYQLPRSQLSHTINSQPLPLFHIYSALFHLKWHSNEVVLNPPGAESTSPEDDSTVKDIEEGWGESASNHEGSSSSDASSSSSAEGACDLKGFFSREVSLAKKKISFYLACVKYLFLILYYAVTMNKDKCYRF